MLQHATSSTLPARVKAFNPLAEIFRRVRISVVEFTAQDIYQICAIAYNRDTIGMMMDAEFMRGLSSAFQRSDQTVLSPFQANVVVEVFHKAGLHVKAKELAVPEEEMVSPESLLTVLKAMLANNNRNEPQMAQVIKLMVPLLSEFSPIQLAQTVKVLSLLQCHDRAFMGSVVKRACEMASDLSTVDITAIATSAALGKLQHNVLNMIFGVVAERCREFQPQEWSQCLQALSVAGPKYTGTLTILVSEGLEHVESMDAATLAAFITAFVTMEFKDKATVEIYLDSLIDKISDLGERVAVQTFQSVHELGLMSQHIFDCFVACLSNYARVMDPRNIPLVMDVCSHSPFKAEGLMSILMDRSVDCVHVLAAGQLGDILEICGLYPPAREHRIVQILGKQASRRLDQLGPNPLAKAVSGLAMLGYDNNEFYLEAAAVYHRWGYKDFKQLEPILIGLCINAGVEKRQVAILGSHLYGMTKQMSLVEIERANRYMNRLGCEEERVYRALADRVRIFVKEVTPDMPQDLQLLLQRGGALSAQAMSEQPEAEEAS
jgi:hypothetical protein